MDHQWISMDYPWISQDIHGYWLLGCPWIIHGTILDVCFVRVFTNFEFTKLPFFILWASITFVIYFGRNREPQRISLWAAGVCKDHVGTILSLSDFPRNLKIMKIDFPSLSRKNVRRNSAQSMPGHFPTIGLLLETNCLFMGLHASHWGGVWGVWHDAPPPEEQENAAQGACRRRIQSL